MDDSRFQPATALYAEVPVTYPKMFSLLILVVVASGCGSQRRVPTHSVQGEVRYKGKALEGAVVLFHPSGGPKPPQIPMIPCGNVKSDGTFSLSTYGNDDGAPEGVYNVTILCPSFERGENERPEFAVIRQLYSNVNRPAATFHVNPGPNQMPPIVLK